MQDRLNAQTQAHINEVQRLIHIVVAHMLKLAEQHDRSKFSEAEAPIFDEFTENLKGTTYGSPEYEAYLEAMKPALDHHYQVNRHHPEHFLNGINGMSLFDLLEMFVDWYAASKRHADGNIWKSIEKNVKRFNLSPQLMAILENTASVLVFEFDRSCGNCVHCNFEDDKGGQCSLTSSAVFNHDGHDCLGFRVHRSKWKPET
jgi:hypothetical protein